MDDLRALAEAALARPNGAVRAAFDNAFTPAAVLALLDRIESLEGVLAFYEGVA